MPSRVPWWQASLAFISQPGPDNVTRRPCGCRIDTAVFGHHCTDRPAASPARCETGAGGRRGEDSQGGRDRWMGADRVMPRGSQRTDPPRPGRRPRRRCDVSEHLRRRAATRLVIAAIALTIPAARAIGRIRAVLRREGIPAVDDQPYCGIELLPHATAADGTPAPVVCTRGIHGPGTMHYNDGRHTYWCWQDVSGPPERSRT